MSRVPSAVPIKPQAEPGDWDANRAVRGEPPTAPNQVGVWIGRGLLGALHMTAAHSKVSGAFTEDWKGVLIQALRETADLLERGS